MPSASGLASVILACDRDLASTRRCLENVLSHTRPPCELILVEDGSSSGVRACLEEVRRRREPEWVELLHTDPNRGAASALIQGLSQARGRYLALLDSATLVTAGWLEGLIAWSLHDWPRIGLVGPVSSQVPPPQQILAEYSTPEGLTSFAALRARSHAQKAITAQSLSGFCLLLRREALQAVGHLDASGGPDTLARALSQHARQAGFRLLVALNVYVHHAAKGPANPQA